MPRTLKRLWGPAQVATGPATVYTAPASGKALLVVLHVNNPSGSPVTFSLSIGADAASTRFYDAYSIPAKAAGVTDSARDIYLQVALEAGEIVQLSAGTNNILVVSASGYEYTAG